MSLTNALRKLQLPKVKYDYFDFHNECKNMRWDRVSILVEHIQDDLLRNGFDCSCFSRFRRS